MGRERVKTVTEGEILNTYDSNDRFIRRIHCQGNVTFEV